MSQSFSYELYLDYIEKLNAYKLQYINCKHGFPWSIFKNIISNEFHLN